VALDWQWNPTQAVSSKFVDLARQAADDAPGQAQSWITLSNLLTNMNRDGEALDVLVEGMQHCPDVPDLRFLVACRMRTLGDYEGALEHCDQALFLNPAHSGATQLRFALLVKTGQMEAAKEHFAEAAEGDPCEPYIFEFLGRRLCRDGVAEELLRRCETALNVNPASANALYFKALALAKLGSEDAARLLSLDRWIEISTPAIPPTYADRNAFLTALAQEILRHPSLRQDPRGKSTSGGRQTGPLQDDDGLAIAAALNLIRHTAEEYADGVEGAAGPFAAGRPAKCSLSAWAVVLGPEGHQRLHRHPDGWLSGVFYVRAPSSGKDRAYSGDLVLGAADESIGVKLPWETRNIEPIPGRLVLFPSYTPHATVFSQAVGDRISVAFDIIPKS
jgi:tetratricopeptide (TPR) repeat protein